MDLLLVDGPNLAYRAHYGARDLTRQDGTPSSAVYGFTGMLCRFIEDFNPRHLVVAWEGVGSTDWRKQAHPAYKAHRNAQPLELSQQLVELDMFVQMLGGVSFGMGGAEADDVIATLTRQGVERGWRIGVLSTDKDLYGLLRPGVQLLRPNNGGGFETWTSPRFIQHYGIDPGMWQVRTALAGDPSDGIPGVKSIGEKTALKLIQDWGDLDHIYANIDRIRPDRCARLLAEGKDSAYLSYKVAGMLDELPLQIDEMLKAAPEASYDAVRDYGVRWELASLGSKLESTVRLRRSHKTA